MLFIFCLFFNFNFYPTQYYPFEKVSISQKQFGDVSASHWAAGYINTASSLGIIKGVGENAFAPDRTVTIAEMTTMAVRALGAGTLVESQIGAGAWPTNYMNFAGETKLTEGVYNVYTSEATRMNAATIVANTLEADVWEKSSVTTNNEVTWEKKAGKTILSSTLNIDVYEEADFETIDTKDREVSGTAKILNGVEKTDKADYFKIIGFDVADGVNMASLKSGVAYDVWYNSNSKAKEIVGIWQSENSKQKVTAFDEIVKITETKVTLSIDGAEKDYNIVTTGDSKSQLVYNNKTKVDLTKAVLESAIDNKENAFGTITVNGSDIETLYVEEYEYAGVVKEVTSTKVEFESMENVFETAKPFKLNNDDLVYNVTKDGVEIDVEDIQVGDIVFYYIDGYDKNIYHVMVETDSHEGTVTSVSSSYIRLDGTKYSAVAGLTMPSAGDEIIIYLNAAGKIVMYDETEVSNSTYAVVKEMQAIEDNKGKLTAEITLVTSDGTEKEKMELDIEETLDDAKFVKEMLAKAVATNASYVLTYDESTITLTAASNGEISEAVGATRTVDNIVYTVTKKGAVDAKAEFKADLDFVFLQTIFGVKGAKSIRDLNGYAYDITTGADAAKSLLGTIVTYKEKSGKLVLTEMTGISSFTKNKTDFLSSETLSLGTKKYITDSTSKYYFTDSTVYMTVKPSTKAYRTKVEVVDVAALETSTTVTAFVGNINDDNEVKLVLLVDNSSLNREKEGNFAVVLSKEDSNSNDFDYAYEVVYTDETVKTYDSDDNSAIVGNAYELTIAGNEITEFADHSYAGGKDKLDQHKKADTSTALYMTKEKNGVIYTAEIIDDGAQIAKSTETSYVLSDSVLYIAHEDGEYSVGKESSIDYLDLEDLKYTSTTTDYAADSEVLMDASRIESIFTYTDEDGVEEVIAIVYSDDKDAIITKIAAATTADAELTPATVVGATASVTYADPTGKLDGQNDKATVVYTAKNGYIFNSIIADTHVAAITTSIPCTVYSVSLSEDGKTLTIVYNRTNN